MEADTAAQKDAHLKQLLSTKKVLSGPFINTVYDDIVSHCSTYYPKLLGTYEAELSPHIETLIKRNPARIVDVGAAEGYYAIGLAMRLQSCEVIAYESSHRARRELSKLCKLNGVAKRVSINGACSAEDLLKLPRLRSLFVVDCEGYEKFILTPMVIEYFADSDFVIETHDGYHPGISEELREKFTATHKVEVVEAIYDIDRPRSFPILDEYRLSNREKVALLRESRMHACLRWLVCYSLKA